MGVDERPISETTSKEDVLALSSRVRARLLGTRHTGQIGGLEILRYIGPGLLVTVGFIDPGNWASNMAAGSEFGYALLWVVTLSTIMLILLQHNVAHLGIATGECLAEATTKFLPKVPARVILLTGWIATVATVMAEVLGGGIALQMLFGLDLKIGSVIVAAGALVLLLTNSYRRVERYIIAIVSVIGIAFLVELALVDVDWAQAAVGWVRPQVPEGSLPIIMSVLGAVVMPHNLFLHSEIIQSRQIDAEGEEAIEKGLKYEFWDTMLSMIIGWAINSAMVILAAATFFQMGRPVTDLAEAAQVLVPIAGQAASWIFAVALLLAGLSSSITAGFAAGTISAGASGEPYDIHDRHSSIGVVAAFVASLIAIFCLSDAFTGLIWSQALLSMQLPITVFLQIYLTSSKRVMGKYANSTLLKVVLLVIGAIVTGLNIALLASM